MSEEESKPRSPRPKRPTTHAEWEYLRRRKFTWLPGDFTIVEPGKGRKNRTDDWDEGTPGS